MKQKYFLKIAMLFVIGLISNYSFGQTTVSYDFSSGGAASGLNEASPGISLDSNIGFGSFKNSGSSNPGIFSSQLRLYQNATKGGSIIIYALNGVTITDVTVTASSRTGPAGYSVDGGATTNLSGSSPYTISGISATSQVEFFQRDTSSSNRIYVDSFQVTYTSGGPAAPGITLGTVSGNTNEDTTTATFTAVLDAQPATNVVLNVSSGDTGEVTISPTTLTFTNGNWDQTQTITATGVDDALIDGNIDVTITLSVDDASSDDDYDAVADVTTTITNDDDEVAPVPTAGTIFITEVSNDKGGDFNSEFIELFNNSNQSVSLSTSKLIRASAANTSEYVYDFGTDESTANVDATIPAYGFIIITRGATLAEFNADQGSTLAASVKYNGGNSQLYFGSTSRRWRLMTGGTSNTDDGTLIDDTGATTGVTRIYRNIFTSTNVNDNDDNGTPGELEYLVYSGGSWVNSVAMDGTTGAKDAYFYDDFTVSTNAAANNIGIKDNKGIAIDSGKNLTINGDLSLDGSSSYLEVSSTVPSAGTVNSGTVILKGTYTSGGTNQFTYFTETYHNNDSGWTLISSPTVGEKVDGNTGNGNFAVFNALQQNVSDYGIAVYDNSQAVSTNRWNYFSKAQIDVGAAVIDMESGKGYSIFPNSTASADQNKGNIGFKGAISTIDVDITLTDGTGSSGNLFNFIGNPYPSFLPFNTNADATNLLTSNTGVLDEETIWLWDKATTSYITVNQTTTLGSGANQRASLYISPAQGFFVKTKTGGGTFTFAEAI